MGNEEIQRSADLQRLISERLSELAYADTQSAQRLGRQIAEIVVVAQVLTANTLPLFLEIDPSNSRALAQVALTIKAQLEEMTDSLVDLRRDLPEWAEFFLSMSSKED